MSLISLNSRPTIPLIIDPTDHEHPINHLFSPTALVPDLTYVDKTYYASHSPFSFPSIFLRCLSRSMQDISTRFSEKNFTPTINTIIFNKALSMLRSISHLDLNHARLFILPSQISRLTRLTFLDLSHNQLETLPESICYLKHLQHLNLANNRIPELPSVVQFFVKLNHLDLSNNPLEELSANIARLTQLTMLDLTGTNISNVPSELLRLTRVSVRVDNCPNIAERSVSFYQTLKYDPPSLLEICSRIVMRPLLLDSATKKKMVSQRTLDSTFSLIPQNVKDFLSSPKACSFCEGPYFKACVLRYRIVQRHDDTYLPVEYRLCSAHWSDEDDRLLTMFAEQPITMIPRLRKRRELRYTVPNF